MLPPDSERRLSVKFFTGPLPAGYDWVIGGYEQSALLQINLQFADFVNRLAAPFA